MRYAADTAGSLPATRPPSEMNALTPRRLGGSVELVADKGELPVLSSVAAAALACIVRVHLELANAPSGRAA